MRRGIRHGGNPPQIYAAALKTITQMELNVAAATAPVTYTMEDVIHWLVPKDIIAKLRAVNSLLSHASSTLYVSTDKVCPDSMLLSMHFEGTGIYAPAPHLLCFDPDTIVVPHLRAVYAVNLQFRNVRAVVQWFNDKQATFGAVRHYWPSMLSLMPDCTALHEADGIRFKDIPGISEIVPLMRETQAIVAAGLLCAPLDSGTPSKVTFQVSFASGTKYALL